LFGWNKVGPGLHFFATLMVALGTLVSATWILASNSWMQTPQGYQIIGGRIVPVEWLQVIFNPSFPYRLAHMTVAAYLATALVVGASGAWHLLKGHDDPRVRTMLSMAMWMLLLVAPVQIFIGDAHGLNTLKYQPAKIAAIEGHWQNVPGENVPLILFGWPDMAAETTRYAVELPDLGSLILTHHWRGRIRRPQGVRARRSPELHGDLLDVPDHGRLRSADAAAGRDEAHGCAGGVAYSNREPSCALPCCSVRPA
jgi:cytochrome d ubiquinol oxidase subunit I